MENNSQKIMILELVDTILRSWWTLVAGTCLGVAAAMLALQYMPRVYEAATRLNLSSRTLPGEFYTDTVAGDEDPELQLAQLREQVLSERYLRNIIDDEHLYLLKDKLRRYFRVFTRICG